MASDVLASASYHEWLPLLWLISIQYASDIAVAAFYVGIIKEINETAKTVVVEYDDLRRVTYAINGLDEIELAYALTIHKSQGSEYPAVLMPLLTGPRMLLNRNLLYTGVTRAKNCVTILGSKETVNQMIANESEQKRYTGLRERICEIMNQEPD